MKYILCNKEKNMLVEHILTSEFFEERDLDLYPSYYEVIKTNEDIISYNFRYDIENDDFVEVDGVAKFVEPFAEPSSMDLLLAKIDMLEKDSKKPEYSRVNELEVENNSLKDELNTIKRHLGLS